MASRRSRGKRRLARRQAHMLAATAARPGLVATTEQIVEEPPRKTLLDLFNEIVPPRRAACLDCGKSQKVRKDGTIGGHPKPGTDSECEGTGKRFNA